MKKKIIIGGLAALSLMAFAAFGTNNVELSAAQRTVYVSPDGEYTNSGTKDSPRNIVAAINEAVPGDTILMAEGVYKSSSRINISSSGKHNAYITIMPAEENAKVVFDFSEMSFDSTNRGIQLTGSFWHFYGLDVTGAGDNGLYIAGNNNIVENCEFYKNRDSGLQLGRGASSQKNISDWPSNNFIKNCTSYYNYDDETLGENADGFAAKLTVGYGNVFDGCIAYRNSDDGWDLYAKEDSGNIGMVSLYNCFSFENGFLPESYEANDGTMTYNTINGDGIGFKLGGGVMEGDVVIDNCVAFNNKLHGFSDNSNPGFINIKNSTAVNNCIGLNSDGTVALSRGVAGDENKSNNFDLARDTDSYNSYYGLLSYINNQADFQAVGNSSYNEDKYRGSVAYSIFQTSYDTSNNEEIYVQAGDYEDVSAYEESALKSLTTKYTGLSDDSFASIASINAIDEKLASIHKEFRNADGSINIGDVLKVVDSKLLTFADGKAIGANLSKTSYADYVHSPRTDLTGESDETMAKLKTTADTLELATNSDAVYQNFDVPLFINGCEISWESSKEEIISISDIEDMSLSSSVYATASVFSPQSDTSVTLTAKLLLGGKSVTKTFTVNVKNRNSSLGSLVSLDGVTTYIISRYQQFKEPTIIVTDATSFDNSALSSSLYTLSKKYEWAPDKNSTYLAVDGIYSSVPGVFRVTTTATLKSDTSVTSSFSYYIFIGDDECEIDFTGGIHTFKPNSIGFNISGTLSNISGKIYAVVVDKNTKLFSYQEIINHKDVQVLPINSDKLSVDFEADNSLAGGYRVYYVISDKVSKNFSEVRSQTIDSVSITTKEEFYNLALGITASNQMTIYNLENNLDFTGFAWNPSESASSFGGTFNGNGHIISNITILNDSEKSANVFYKLENGTIMNVDFSNISIKNSALSSKLTGIVGAMNGGYISDVNLTNITAVGLGASSTCVGALVGQMIGGINYIDHVTLINDENQLLRAGNKYVGGIVGNIQMDSGIDKLEAYISYCVVKADIGDGTDSGGCVAGIVGRTKNDKDTYYLNVNNCYYSGTVTVKGNYNAGIVGSVESGKGNYNISNNYADVVFVYCKEGRTVLDAKEIAKILADNPDYEYQIYAHKNLNPICGRATTLSTDVLGTKNAGSWQEYFSTVIYSVSIYFSQGADFVLTKEFLQNYCDWDFTNDWAISADGSVSLK